MRKLVVLVIFLALCGPVLADTLTIADWATNDILTASALNAAFTACETVVNGLIDASNIEDGTITGDDLSSAIIITTSGVCTFSGANVYSGTSTFSGNITADDGTTDSPSFTFKDATDETAIFAKTDAGFLTLTTVAGDGLNVVTGNLKIGNGTPGNTQDGEDFYCEGEGEFDGGLCAGGTMEVTGAVTMASTLTVTGATVLNGGLTLDGTGLTVADNTGNTTIAGTLAVNGATVTLGDASGDAVTVNSGTITLANDTAVTLSGGLNGINFDSNTLSIDAAQNFVGIGTNAPACALDVIGSAYFETTTYLGVTTTYFDTSGSLVMTNGSTIGLGSGKGSITFTDTTVDTLTFSNARLGTGAAYSYIDLNLGDSITATSSYAIGININNTYTASANNDILAGIYVHPTFTDGAYVGVTHYDVWGSGTSRFSVLSVDTTATAADLTATDDLDVADFGGIDALRVGTTHTDPGDGHAYIETSIDGDFALIGTLSASTFSAGSAAQAANDGILTVFPTDAPDGGNAVAWKVESDSANPPTVDRAWGYYYPSSAVVTTTNYIKKGDYVLVTKASGTGNLTIHWQPIGADN